jgi:DNA topoisomerase-3
MYKKLYIAEKPSLALAIAERLAALSGAKMTPVRGDRGVAYYTVGNMAVAPFVGHMYEQYEPEDYDKAFEGSFKKSVHLLPFIPGQWKLKPVAKTRSQLDVVNRLIKESETLVNAGDPDDEGQLLVDEALDYIGNRKPTKRVLLTALDPASIDAALNSEQDNADFFPIYQAAKARQQADFLVGINMTRACTCVNAAGDMLTVGRVQTPTAALLVARRLAIENFVPRDYYEPMPEFAHPNGSYKGSWVAPKDFDGLDEEGRLVDQSVARSIVDQVKGKPGQIADYAVKPSTQKQPLPFTLGTLQARASKLYGMSPAQVLTIAQQLYEVHKVASYPRTDSGYLKQSQHAEAPAVLAAIAQFDDATAALVAAANPAIKSEAWNDKNVQSHHGIIPTTSGNFFKLSVDEKRVFSLIVKQYIAQFYPEYSYNQTTVVTRCGGHHFRSSGRTPTNVGWRKVFGADDIDDDKEKKAAQELQKLPPMNPADQVQCTTVDTGTKTTRKPNLYTKGTLLQDMENIAETVSDPVLKQRLRRCKGIGTPATQANTIERLEEVGYLVTKGKNIDASDGCVQFIEQMPRELSDPAMTALWQGAMDRIKAKELTLPQFMESQVKWVTGLTQKTLGMKLNISLKSSKGKAAGPQRACPQCKDGTLIQKTAKTGANAGKPFIACTGYPECKYSENVTAKSGGSKAGSSTGRRPPATKATGESRSKA